MPNPPWKRELPPQPPRDREFVSPDRPAQSTPRDFSPPGIPRHLKNDVQSLGNFGQQRFGREVAKHDRSRRKIGIGSLLGIIGLLLIGFVTTNLNGESDVASKPTEVDKPVASTSPQQPTVTEIKPVPAGLWDSVARSIVYIEATGSQCNWTGSGSIVLDGSFVLTNQHVSGSGECTLQVFLTDSVESAPTKSLIASLVVFDNKNDLAVLRIFGDDGKPFIDKSRTPLVINELQLALGAKLFTLGYPGAGGSTITFTSGDFAGMDDVDGVFYKTTAYMNSGVSGGAGLNERGELVGIPTAGKIDSVTNEKLGINLIRPVSFAQNLLQRALEKSPQTAEDSATATEDSFTKGSDSSGASQESPADPIFGTCAEAKSRGYGPYYSGQDYEYSFYYDRDRDGVVCE
jgi:S1-C subfamily serine protease